MENNTDNLSPAPSLPLEELIAQAEERGYQRGLAEAGAGGDTPASADPLILADHWRSIWD